MRRIQQIAIVLVFALMAASCGKDGAEQRDTTSAANEQKQLYQCAMHPNIVEEKPGSCPICGMELQPVMKAESKGIPGRAAVELTDQQRQLINIRTVPVQRKEVSRTVRAVGTVTYDQSKVAAITSRVKGWVEKLYVDTPGAVVEQGQPLMELYSPDLYSAAQDYLLAYRAAQSAPGGGRFAQARSADADALLESARKRLELLGIAPEQIKALEQSKSATPAIPIVAPISGTVVEKNVVQGQMIEPNAPLYRIADLSQVWIEAQLYEYELPLVKIGQEVTVTIPAFPERTFTGKVDFIYPSSEGTTRTTKARVILDNPNALLKPDMYANVQVEAGLGEELVVPASAVFDTGKRQYVFVQEKPGSFVPKLVELGPKVGDDFVVSRGLEAEQEVVVNGNFLLDSESQLKAAASGAVEPTDDAAAAPLENPPKRARQLVTPLSAAAAAVYRPLLDDYLRVKDLLARDTIDGGPALADAMRQKVAAISNANVVPGENVDIYRERLSGLQKAVETFKAASLDETRVAFGNLSFALVALISEFPPPLDRELYVFNCPMWEKSPGRWIQRKREVENPFMGQAMLTCGELVSDTTLEGAAK